jgi:uncharacterized protein YhbP (UPF0306 family)
MQDQITRFIKGQRCASMCCTEPGGDPYCFSCFYAFNPEEGLLYIKTSPTAHHARLMSERPQVAGTIQPDRLSVLAVKGIQFSGYLLPAGDELCADASGRYHRRFPMAMAVPGEVWAIRLTRIKMTDSTIGFGKKISWEREALLEV